ncbi:MAG: hypothetical protein F6K36_26400 [Symploca sp. SIO3C6]|nr:hypothetical protein [Symploca sp. SIO3C6]
MDDYFKEICLDAKPVEIDQVSLQTAVIYAIILPKRLAVILSLPNQPLSYHETALPQAEVENLLQKMRQSQGGLSYLQEKELLLKEVYHRVKNNLQVITSIFSLQSQYIEEPQMLSILTECQNRIHSMALIHQKLYQSDSLT